jgi:hypothetical protein
MSGTAQSNANQANEPQQHIEKRPDITRQHPFVTPPERGDCVRVGSWVAAAPGSFGGFLPPRHGAFAYEKKGAMARSGIADYRAGWLN